MAKMYEFAGVVNVPADKKEEMNRYVLELLDKCGIRKRDELVVAGVTQNVAVPARPGEDGVVWFDYSVFGKCGVRTCSYNMDTCELEASGCGSDEFGLAMNLIMTLLEIYTDADCYLLCDGKPCQISCYIEILETLLGVEFRLGNRGRMWDMYRFLHGQGYAGITEDDIFYSFPWYHGYYDLEQMTAVVALSSDRINVPEECRGMEREDIAGASYTARQGYLALKMADPGLDDRDGLRAFLKELLDAGLERRKELAGREDTYGDIAKVSLYMLPAHIAHAYACQMQISFWEVWDSLGIRGYQDIIGGNRLVGPAVHEDIRIPLYEAFNRKFEDEFLEFWDGENLHLSSRMRDRIREWQSAYQNIGSVEDVNAEHCLSGILMDHTQYGMRCRRIDGQVVEEFLLHGDDQRYKKALIVIRRQMDGYKSLFSSMPGHQIISLILRRYMDDFEFISIDAFFSLMGNHQKRMELFGF